MKHIRSGIGVLWSVEFIRADIEKFAKNKFDEKFKDKKPTYDYSYNVYDKFEVISDHSIRIHYKYGGGDMEFDDSFVVEL